MLFYRYTYMSEMAFGTFLFRTNILIALSKEDIKPLIKILLIPAQLS